MGIYKKISDNVVSRYTLLLKKAQDLYIKFNFLKPETLSSINMKIKPGKSMYTLKDTPKRRKLKIKGKITPSLPTMWRW